MKPNGSTLVPIEGGGEVLPFNTKQEHDMQAIAERVIKKTAAEVLNVLMDEVSRKTEEVLDRASKLATLLSANKVAIAVQINDGPQITIDEGAHPLLGQVISMLKVGLTPLLVGPAGSGKTMMAEQASRALQLPFGHLCFSAGVSETWLFGRQTPNGFIEGDFSRLYRDGGVYLADELDAADPNLLLAINTALANGHLYNPISGQRIARHQDFHFIGAANTYGKGADSLYTGRARLDAATLDRFTVIEVKYEEQIEDQLLADKPLRSSLRKIRSKLAERESNEVVSYRMFLKTQRLLNAGMKKDAILNTLTASWPKALVKEIKIHD